MKIIDFHTHIFPDTIAQRAIASFKENVPHAKPYTNGTIDGLNRSMQQHHVTKSVLLPIATKPGQVATINTNCAALRTENCIPFGTLHPDLDRFESEIMTLQSNAIQGIKLHPEYQSFYVNDTKLFPLYEALAASKLIVVFHAGKDPGPFTGDHALPSALLEIVNTFPALKIVAAHMGGWKVWADVEKTLCGMPLYFDTAAVRKYLPQEDFIRIARKHGIDRILFGSDSPWYDQGEDIDWINSLPLSDNEKEKIFWRNAEELLNN
jgi:hypothetical protein